MTDDEAIELGDLVRQVMIAVMEVRRAGSPEQLTQARAVLAQTRRSMYRILAEDDPTGTSDRHSGHRHPDGHRHHDHRHGDSHRHGGGRRRAGRRRVSEPVVQVTDLVKRYGEIEAVRGINFAVTAGETFGFLGPNGAGKSTTIKILCTLANPTSGSARVAGYDVVKDRDEVRRNIGLVFQDTTLDAYLTGEQNLRFHADLYGVPRQQLAPRLKQVLEMVNLWDRKDSVVSTYSGGMKRRLEIARGLLHAPRVLFLDEPTVGLDPQTRSSIWEYVNDLKQREDITIFLTTHYMDEAEHCDRIAIIDHGKIVAIDTPENLKASVGKDRVQISTADDQAAHPGDQGDGSTSTRPSARAW